MQPAQHRVEPASHHLGKPVVETGEKPEDHASRDDEMEVCYDKHAAMQNFIGGKISQVDAADSADDEVYQHSRHKQQWDRDPDLPAPERTYKHQEEDAGGNRDQFCIEHEGSDQGVL